MNDEYIPVNDYHGNPISLTIDGNKVPVYLRRKGKRDMKDQPSEKTVREILHSFYNEHIKTNNADAYPNAEAAINAHIVSVIKQITQEQYEKAERRGKEMTKSNRSKFARDHETMGESYARTQGFKSACLVIKDTAIAKYKQADKS